MFTYSSLVMMDFMHTGTIPEEDDREFWVGLIKECYEAPGMPVIEREEKLAECLNTFVEGNAVQHSALTESSGGRLPSPACLAALPTRDKNGCAHAVYTLVRSQLKSVSKATWERAFSHVGDVASPVESRRDFFSRANELLKNSAVRRCILLWSCIFVHEEIVGMLFTCPA